MKEPIIFRLPAPILRSTTSNFGMGHLVYRRSSVAEKSYFPAGTQFLCGHILPPFQRPHVWTQAQSIRFIESAWLGLHLGTYIVNRNDGWVDGHPHRTDLWLIDGQQRLTALEHYFTDQFPVFGLRWSELNEVEVRRFEAVPFAQGIIRNGDEAELRDLYERLNFGGTVHTGADRLRLQHKATP